MTEEWRKCLLRSTADIDKTTLNEWDMKKTTAEDAYRIVCRTNRIPKSIREQNTVEDFVEWARGIGYGR